MLKLFRNACNCCFKPDEHVTSPFSAKNEKTKKKIESHLAKQQLDNHLAAACKGPERQNDTLNYIGYESMQGDSTTAKIKYTTPEMPDVVISYPLPLDQKGADLLKHCPQTGDDDWVIVSTASQKALKYNEHASHLKPSLPNALPQKEPFSLSGSARKIKSYMLNFYFSPK